MPPPNGGQGQGIEVVHPYYKIVKGLPAAIVRSYKEPLYDAELIIATASGNDLIMFQKPIGQTLADNTTRKTLLHTNMTQAGQLGTPLSFDVYGFNARLPKDIGLTSFRNIMINGVAQVVFGQDTTFLTVPLEDIPSGVDVEGMGANDNPHIGWGTSDNLYRFDIGGRALHINSTEGFQVKISFPSGGPTITGDQLLRWYIRGIKYKGV